MNKKGQIKTIIATTFYFTISLLFFSDFTFAAKGKPIIWKNEPQSLLGVKIGKPISESMKECQKSGKYEIYNLKGDGSMCWSGDSRGYGIWNYQSLGIVIFSLRAYEINRLVEFVEFTFDQREYIEAASLLKAKYGKPTTEEVVKVQNRMGATFDNFRMSWVGENLTLLFESHSDKLTEGRVTIYSRKYSESKRFDVESNKNKL